MLSPQQFDAWCKTWALSDEAIERIREIRLSPPVRSPGNRRGNVRGRFTSGKMGRTIAFESALECAAIWEMEYNPDVLEYWDQPCLMKVSYVLPSGDRHAHWGTPDFLVLRRGNVELVEWKYAAELQTLLVERSYLYTLGDAGSWQSPPWDTASQEEGLTHVIRDDTALNPVWRRNIELLEDYLRPDAPDVPAAAAEALVDRVRQDPGLTVAQVIKTLPTGCTVDHVYTLIAHGALVTDLRRNALAEGDRVGVFPNLVYAEAYGVFRDHPAVVPPPRLSSTDLEPLQNVVWDGRPWVVLNPGEQDVTFRSMQDETVLVQLRWPVVQNLVLQGHMHLADPPGDTTVSPLHHAHPQAVADAVARFRVIEPFLGHVRPDRPPSRTERRYLAAWRAAERAGQSGLVGLLSRRHLGGNRTSHPVDPRTLALAHETIQADYLSPKQMHVSAVYGRYKTRAEEQHLTPLSLKTFYGLVHGYQAAEKDGRRRGPRAAYQAQGPMTGTPMPAAHADIPWQRTHLDHTEVDVETASRLTGRPLRKRPWLTALIDECSRRVLAAYLSLYPPSAESCLMAFRLCVQRFGRLPRNVVVDNGREFDSVQFEQFLARYRTNKIQRPPHEPRYGNVVERLFGVANQQLFHLLLGNTQIMTEVRQVTKSFNPQTLAVWTFDDLQQFVEIWAHDVHDRIPHPALGTTPQAYYERRVAETGLRPHMLIPYDDDFVLWTLPAPKRPAKVSRNGVRINYFDYWNDAFLNSDLRGKQLPLRYDPSDLSTAYAYVGTAWERLYVPRYGELLDGLSERELRSLTTELRLRAQQAQDDRLHVTAPVLVQHLDHIEEHETVARQRQLVLEQPRRHLDLPSAATLDVEDSPELDADSDTGDAPEDAEADPLQPKGEFQGG
jgi:putative transposase